MDRSGLPVVSVLDNHNISAFKSIDEITIIAFIDPEDVSTESTFRTVATRNNDKFTFGIAYTPSLAEGYNVPFPSIVCYRSQHSEIETLQGRPGLNDMQRFLDMSTVPLVGRMTRRNEMNYLKV